MAPYLRGDGLRRQVVLEGNRLVLTCLAGGSWPLQYRWTLNNSNLTDWTPHYRSVVFHPDLSFFVFTPDPESLWSPGNCCANKLVFCRLGLRNVCRSRYSRNAREARSERQSSVSQSVSLCATRLIFLWPWVPLCAYLSLVRAEQLPPGETAAVKQNCFSPSFRKKGESWEHIRSERGRERFVSAGL